MGAYPAERDDELGDAPELRRAAAGPMGRLSVVHFAQRAQTTGVQLTLKLVQNFVAKAEGLF